MFSVSLIYACDQVPSLNTSNHLVCIGNAAKAYVQRETLCRTSSRGGCSTKRRWTNCLRTQWANLKGIRIHTPSGMCGIFPGLRSNTALTCVLELIGNIILIFSIELEIAANKYLHSYLYYIDSIGITKIVHGSILVSSANAGQY